jgi:hypothetical protein
MKRAIKIFAGGRVLEFDAGKFDDWCIYLSEPGGQRTAPKDVDYFARLQVLAKKHGAEKIYEDVVAIYRKTTAQLDATVLNSISTLSKKYSADAAGIEELLTMVYAGMVAEENKQGAMLKKRIKRLGLHQVLIENLDPEKAAVFSKGKSWRELDDECRARKF